MLIVYPEVLDCSTEQVHAVQTGTTLYRSWISYKVKKEIGDYNADMFQKAKDMKGAAKARIRPLVKR